MTFTFIRGGSYPEGRQGLFKSDGLGIPCGGRKLFSSIVPSQFCSGWVARRSVKLALIYLFGTHFLQHVDMGIFDLINLEGRVSRYETDTFLPKWKVTRKLIEEIAESPDPPPRPKPVKMKVNRYLCDIRARTHAPFLHWTACAEQCFQILLAQRLGPLYVLINHRKMAPGILS